MAEEDIASEDRAADELIAVESVLLELLTKAPLELELLLLIEDELVFSSLLSFIQPISARAAMPKTGKVAFFICCSLALIGVVWKLILNRGCG